MLAQTNKHVRPTIVLVCVLAIFAVATSVLVHRCWCLCVVALSVRSLAAYIYTYNTTQPVSCFPPSLSRPCPSRPPHRAPQTSDTATKYLHLHHTSTNPMLGPHAKACKIFPKSRFSVMKVSFLDLHLARNCSD